MRSDMTMYVGLVMAAIGLCGALWHLSGRWRRQPQPKTPATKSDEAAADADEQKA